MTVRISMWSGPRNISTAIMYAFRQRSDTSVVDEPLYGHYLATTGADHPGRAEVLAAMDLDGERVVRKVLLGPSPTPVRFFKNMAHHLVGLDRGFLGSLTNVILTRDPAEMLLSLVHQLPDPDLDATGLPAQVALLDDLVELGQDPVVFDSALVLDDPGGVLAEACRRIGIPFEEGMLTWPPGPKPEDGVWAPHWYGAVHASTGFGPRRRKREPVPDRLAGLLEEARPLYERLAVRAVLPRSSGRDVGEGND